MEENNIPVDELVTVKKSSLDDRKFRKRLLIASRIIAIALIIAIIYVGWVNYKYGTIFEGKSACYRCGYENMRRCECVYLPELVQQEVVNISAMRDELANYNDKMCEVKEGNKGLNISGLNLPSS